MNDLVRRQLALQKTIARFGGKAFKLGSADCAQLARFHLKAMGHRKLPATGKYATPAGAARALRRHGVQSFEGLMDALLPRIAPAAMLPGDVALVPEDPDKASGLGGTLVVFLGRKWLSWHPDLPQLAKIEPVVERPFLAAWRG